MRYERISADCHLDLCWLPPDLFVANASAAMKDRMPHVIDGPKGPMWVTKKGANLGLACLPYGDIDAAVKEIYRVARLGLRGMELSCSWDMEPMWHPCWEPLWKAVNDVNLPLHFHTFPHCRSASSSARRGSRAARPSSPWSPRSR